MLQGSTQFFSKTSLLLLFYRIFSPDKTFRYKLYATTTILAATTLTSIPLSLALCLPGESGSWLAAQPKCLKTEIFGYVQGPTNITIDLFMIYLPASVVMHLNMPMRHKLGVMAIFATGMLLV